MDEYKVKVTRQAKEHLALIREYIATELKEPTVAKRVLELLKAEMMSLQTMPYRVKCIDEQPWGELGFRRIRVKNYYVYFCVDDSRKEVQILAVIYVRRGQTKQLEQL
ncbi:type II toxin-antitoxin system RelE/ParE family toxin [Gardnerella vaginalis]|uniref:Plasmid stabilization system protein, RelE/ParE family n=1 Tax=Gardnerella vaginalis (strain ATCC 14019 / 317) TaxID=525284 RepID=E3DAQ4_GARV3|nr:type II toxin-antitoxin system RelE/ParE family toxin [Gardnerella vaginalis]CQB87010.1 Plasmid stabilisation system protein [Chlamydia trachomatis]ADP39148.1 plasmid stabilization system protein, RelE/ParE family [Gardnerella vaginalis ATCC 14019]AYZ22163.1 type II toxin-antitoxin system RelE/ParE family toxin [Gardnerella vaginalis]KOS08863.1 addiction module toxin RelE [Gardnerella vaginalis]NSX25149.1 type II toxin-antitoxin system RelE/ParE family toxin [Gardnerella vaginalis]